jgi:predicted transcriptional regulator
MDNKPARLRNKELTPRMKQVVEYLFDHPQSTQKQIGNALGISDQRVSQILRSNRVLAAFPIVARMRVKQMIPKAVKAQQELIEQKENLMVRDKASARVLETGNIFVPQPTVQVNVIQQLTNDELARLVNKNQSLTLNSVDTDIVETDIDLPTAE